MNNCFLLFLLVVWLNMILIAKLIFSLWAHVTHVLDVLNICDVMSIWSWAHVFHVLVFHAVYCLVKDTCQAYVLGICDV